MGERFPRRLRLLFEVRDSAFDHLKTLFDAVVARNHVVDRSIHRRLRPPEPPTVVKR
jgi:hypothetical protein